jgi:hypothetical protein
VSLTDCHDFPSSYDTSGCDAVVRKLVQLVGAAGSL